MKIKLLSIAREEALAGSNHWRYDATIQDHVSGFGNGAGYGRKMANGPGKGKSGKGEGHHPVGIAHRDKYAYITFGSGDRSATWCNSYCIGRTLDTDKLRKYLH